MRFLSAQLEAYLANDLWLRNARRANALAARLAAGIEAIPGGGLAQTIGGNTVFAWLPQAVCARLREAGAVFYDWDKDDNGRVLVRLVCAFATPDEAVTTFLDVARG